MKLNLGCGNKKLPGFVNVDIRPEVEPDLVDDIQTLNTMEKGSVDLIYCCHALEHFPREQSLGILCRWYEILKPQGILRISVPDMEAVFAHYFYWKDIRDLKGFIWGGQKDSNDFHKDGWDETFLTIALTSTGFVNVHKWDWKTTSPHDYIDDYSQAYWPTKECNYQDGQIRAYNKLMSLNLEGAKPSYEPT